jgi:hypothetical protein
VQDFYELRVTLTIDGKSVTRGYQHVLITVVGSGSGPTGVAPTTLSAGFATVIEQMLLNALSDLQQYGMPLR